MGLDLQKLTKSLHGLTELKMTLQSVRVSSGMVAQKNRKIGISGLRKINRKKRKLCIKK